MEPISSSTVADVRAAYDLAWGELARAIDAAAGAWNERVLAPEDGGAEPWSARLAAWHAIAGERIRLAYLDHLLAKRPESPGDMMAFAASGDAPDDASMDRLRAEFRTIETPAQMQDVLQQTRQRASDWLAGLSGDDLQTKAVLVEFVQSYMRERGQAPSDDVRGVLVHGLTHLLDHAHQITEGVSRQPK